MCLPGESKWSKVYQCPHCSGLWTETQPHTGSDRHSGQSEWSESKRILHINVIHTLIHAHTHTQAHTEPVPQELLAQPPGTSVSCGRFSGMKLGPEGSELDSCLPPQPLRHLQQSNSTLSFGAAFIWTLRSTVTVGEGSACIACVAQVVLEYLQRNTTSGFHHSGQTTRIFIAAAPLTKDMQ